MEQSQRARASRYHARDMSRRSSSLGRRSFVAGATCALAFGRGAHAGASPRSAVPTIPLQLRGGRGLDLASLPSWIANANEVFAPHRLAFEEAAPARADLDGVPAEVVTRADRDAYAAHLTAGVVSVFLVERLLDVDEPGRTRMGVAWRSLRDPEKRYVLVAAYAKPFVLAHELGHFFGNPHSKVRNNLMSYEHDEGVPPFLDAAQGETARRAAQALFAEKKLVETKRTR